MVFRERAGHRCHVDRIEKEVDPRALEEGATVRLRVAGMGCPNCAARVHNALLGQSGVLAAEVNLERALATVTIDPQLVGPTDLSAAVHQAGAGTHHVYRAFLIVPTLH